MGQYGWAGNETALGKTSSADIRRIIAAQYVNTHRNPIIGGGEVSGRADMSYGYAAGVGLRAVADGAVILTWLAGVTALVTASPAARTDVIYCDADGAVRVAEQGTINESTVTVLRRMRTPAGMTATSQATPVGDRDFALPYGASLAWLNRLIDPLTHGTRIQTSRHVWRQLPFAVPTDRVCRFEMQQCILGEHNNSAPSTDFTQFGAASMMYWAYLDDVLIQYWELGYNRIAEVRPHHFIFEAAEGAHTFRIERAKQWGTADPLAFGEMGGGGGWQPASVGIRDEGIAE